MKKTTFALLISSFILLLTACSGEPEVYIHDGSSLYRHTMHEGDHAYISLGSWPTGADFDYEYEQVTFSHAEGKNLDAIDIQSIGNRMFNIHYEDAIDEAVEITDFIYTLDDGNKLEVSVDIVIENAGVAANLLPVFPQAFDETAPGDSRNNHLRNSWETSYYYFLPVESLGFPETAAQIKIIDVQAADNPWLELKDLSYKPLTTAGSLQSIYAEVLLSDDVPFTEMVLIDEDTNFLGIAVILDFELTGEPDHRAGGFDLIFEVEVDGDAYIIRRPLGESTGRWEKGS